MMLMMRKVGVGHVAFDAGDRIDVFLHVAIDVRGAQLAVRGQGSAVATGKVVNHELRVGGVLGHGRVEVVAQAHAARAAVDGGDAIHPHAGRGIRDATAARLGVGLGFPLGIHVALGVDEGIRHARRGRAADVDRDRDGIGVTDFPAASVALRGVAVVSVVGRGQCDVGRVRIARNGGNRFTAVEKFDLGRRLGLDGGRQEAKISRDS
jgi:hypothetical protein